MGGSKFVGCCLQESIKNNKWVYRNAKLKQELPCRNVALNCCDAAGVEELAEPKFTHHANVAAISTHFQCFTLFLRESYYSIAGGKKKKPTNLPGEATPTRASNLDTVTTPLHSIC